MIGRLTGKVLAQEADGSVVLDVGGVGYEVTVPMGTLGRATCDDAGLFTLWIHTHVREDALALFGFSDQDERAAFRMLLGVSNVGPRIAVAVLGALPCAALADAIARRNLPALTTVPGIGKKIAERLLLELRDKLPISADAGGRPKGTTPRSAPAATSDGEQLKSALTGMGFKPAEAERAVAALAQRSGAPMQELLREALALLAR